MYFAWLRKFLNVGVEASGVGHFVGHFVTKRGATLINSASRVRISTGPPKAHKSKRSKDCTRGERYIGRILALANPPSSIPIEWGDTYPILPRSFPCPDWPTSLATARLPIFPESPAETNPVLSDLIQINTPSCSCVFGHCWLCERQEP